EEALNVLTSAGRKTWLALFFVWRGEVLALQGHLEEAEEQAQDALALAREGGYRGYQAYALRLLAELASRRSFDSSASTRYGERALAEQLGMRPLVAHCHLGLGKLYRRTGKRDQAHEHLTAATTMYCDMDMQYWLEQAEAEMEELDV